MMLSKTIILKKKMFYAPRGFLIDFDDNKLLKSFTEEVKKYIKKENGIFLKIDPYVVYNKRDKDGSIIDVYNTNDKVIDDLKKLGFIHHGFDLNARNLQPRWISVLDLQGLNVDTLINTFDTQRRSRVNKAIKLGFDIKELSRDELIEFKKITEETGKRRGFIDRPLSYYEYIYDEFVKNKQGKFMCVELDLKKAIDNLKQNITENKEKISEIEKEMENHDNKTKFKNQIKEINNVITSLESRHKLISDIKEKHQTDKQIMSAALFLTFGSEVVYLASGSYKEFMELNAQYFMQWEMIKYAIENKYKVYNFYGISGNFDKDNERYGVFDFKKGFNATVNELIGEFDLPISKFWYFLYTQAFKIYRNLKKVNQNND